MLNLGETDLHVVFFSGTGRLGAFTLATAGFLHQPKCSCTLKMTEQSQGEVTKDPVVTTRQLLLSATQGTNTQRDWSSLLLMPGKKKDWWRQKCVLKFCRRKELESDCTQPTVPRSPSPSLVCNSKAPGWLPGRAQVSLHLSSLWKKEKLCTDQI